MIRCRLYYESEKGRAMILGYGRTETAAEKQARLRARKRKIALSEDPIVEFDTVRGKN